MVSQPESKKGAKLWNKLHMMHGNMPQPQVAYDDSDSDDLLGPNTPLDSDDDPAHPQNMIINTPPSFDMDDPDFPQVALQPQTSSPPNSPNAMSPLRFPQSPVDSGLDFKHDVPPIPQQAGRPPLQPVFNARVDVDAGGDQTRTIYCGLDQANKPPNSIRGNSLQCLRKGYAIGRGHVRT
jgi:hypothetical protein